jgi:hypothetical protein
MSTGEFFLKFKNTWMLNYKTRRRITWNDEENQWILKFKTSEQIAEERFCLKVGWSMLEVKNRKNRSKNRSKIEVKNRK